MFTKDDLIFAYTRQQALADGVLRDVTPFAWAAGIRYPTALTAGVWAACVGTKGKFELELPGLMRLLHEFVAAAKAAKDKSRLQFQAAPADGSGEAVTVVVVCGPDDDGAPCLTIMLPEDD